MNKLFSLPDSKIKKILDNCFDVAIDRFQSLLVDDACEEMSYFLSIETKIKPSGRKRFEERKEQAIADTLKYMTEVKNAFYSLSEPRMKQIKSGYFSYFRPYDVVESKEKKPIIRDFTFAIMDTMYHYFDQLLMIGYKEEIKEQLEKAESLFAYTQFIKNEDGYIVETKNIYGLIDGEMRDRVKIRRKLFDYRKGDEKYLFFKFMGLQNVAVRNRLEKHSAFKGMARRINGLNEKTVIKKLDQIPNYVLKIMRHHFPDIL